MRYQTQVGDWQVTEVHDGRFKLDGGAMFGVVPRPLWEKLIPPDEAGRIPLALRCLLMRGHDRVALIDTGMGSKWTDKERVIYAVDHSETDLLKDLAEVGVSPEDVTDVLITHLHFDHAGGNTRRTEDGSLVATFPHATYHVPAANLAHALLPEERDHVSYRKENWEVLEAAGVMETFAPGTEVLPGVLAEEWSGHTPGMVTYRIQGAEADMVYCADLIPTASHIRLNYVMGYDLCARTTIREKREFLPQAVEKGWNLFFEHDPVHPTAEVTRDDRGRYVVRGDG